MSVKIRPIGLIRTPFQNKVGMPIQGPLTPDYRGIIELDEKWAEGLKDIEGFSHLILLYLFHQAEVCEKSCAKPFMDDVEHGVFAIRSPVRPNPIGLTTVRLVSHDGPRLEVDGVDMLDKTPLIDIKPYLPKVDSHPEATSGWAERGLLDHHRHTADDRFGH